MISIIHNYNDDIYRFIAFNGRNKLLYWKEIFVCYHAIFIYGSNKIKLSKTKIDTKKNVKESYEIGCVVKIGTLLSFEFCIVFLMFPGTVIDILYFY